MAVVTLTSCTDYRLSGVDTVFVNGVRETVADDVADTLEATGYFNINRTPPTKKGSVTIKTRDSDPSTEDAVSV